MPISRTPIGIFCSVHLDARQISHRMPFPLCQGFLISCNKLHATREIKSSAVDFSDVFEIHRPFGRLNIVRHSSVHLDARWIPHRTSCYPWVDQTPCRSTDSSNATSRTNTLRTSFFTSTILDFVQQVARYEGHKIKCGGFFWGLKRCWNSPHFWEV